MTYPTKKLGEVAILNPKKSEIKGRADSLPVSFVPMHGVDEYLQSITKHETRELRSVRKGYTYFKNGDVLFAKITPCMENGKVAIARDLENEIGFGSTEFHIIRPTNCVTSEWIFHIVASQSFRDEAHKHMHGVAGQKRVPTEFLADYEIPIPPIAEQRRIVARIEKQFLKIDEAARLHAESQALTEKLLPAALHKIFSVRKSMSEIGELCSLINGRAFKSSEWQREGKYPIIRIQNLNSRIKGFNYFSGTVDPKVVVYRGDLLFSWSGSRGTSFGPHVWYGETGVLNQHIFKVRHEENIDRLYFYYALKHLVTEVENTLHGGVGLVHITKTKLERLKIPLPPLAEQKAIVKELDVLTEKARALLDLQSSQASDLKALKQSILHEAFTSRIGA